MQFVIVVVVFVPYFNVVVFVVAAAVVVVLGLNMVALSMIALGSCGGSVRKTL